MKNRISVNDIAKFPKHIQDQLRDYLARPFTNVESRYQDAIKSENRVDKMVTPVRVRIHSKRKRLGDAVEGYCGKPCIDGLVCSGLLPDDSAKYIPQIAEQTHEIGKDEETIITVETIEAIGSDARPHS